MDIGEVQHLWRAEPGWLNTASYGLPPQPGWDALQAALDGWRSGRAAWEEWDTSTGRSRAAFARLLGVPVADVAVGSAVSQLLAPLACSLPSGARVVVPDIEFTSNLFPWLAQAQRNIEVITVPAARLPESIDARTDVVAFSLVQSMDGSIARYDDIVAAARQHHALVVVDASQACGWLPFAAEKADFVAVCGYKWLMSPRGAALAYISPAIRERMMPVAAGWYAGEDVFKSFYGPPLRLADSARRFDISPAWFSYVGMAPTLELIEQIGIENIRAHDLRMANRFRAGLGLPDGDSAIVVVEVPGAEQKLGAAGLRAAVRGGRVRTSFHVYTTTRDVDLAVEALTQ